MRPTVNSQNGNLSQDVCDALHPVAAMIVIVSDGIILWDGLAGASQTVEATVNRGQPPTRCRAPSRVLVTDSECDGIPA